MSENVTDELLLGYLKAIQYRLSNLETGQDRIKTSLIDIQQHMAGFMTTVAADESAIAELENRLDRLERCLDLVEPPAS